MYIAENKDRVITTLILQKSLMYVQATEKWLDELLTYEEVEWVVNNIDQSQKDKFPHTWYEIKGLWDNKILIPTGKEELV